MHTLTGISDKTFDRFKAHAEPFVDDFESTLSKVLDLADKAKNVEGAPPTTKAATSAKQDLTHTFVTSASIDGVHLHPSQKNWNAILLATIDKAAGKASKGADISRHVIVNYVPGEKQINGYKYIKSANISVQGQNANNAWKAIAHLAKATGTKVEISFVWGDHPKALHPGQSGTLIT